MRVVINLLGGLLAFGWGAVATDYIIGARKGRSLTDIAPYPVDADAPSLSVIVAACNEEEKLPAAFRTLLAQEYPGSFEIVAIDDRSTDNTPGLLDQLVQEGESQERRIVVLHLNDLPKGWLGKNHALYQGARNARGRWLLFTDADIRFAPDALSRAVRFAEAEKLHHLVSFMRLELEGFWENVFGLTFAFFFFLKFRPWRVRNPRTKEYLGVGGFNMVRRDAYEAIGTHRAIALEVADDMELGRRIKTSGFTSEVVGAGDLISVRWQEGFAGLMNGLTKNGYAGLDYNPLTVVQSSGLLFMTCVWPLMGLFLATDKRARIGYATALGAIIGTGMIHARYGRIPPAYALSLPLSSLLLIIVMFRSMLTTEHNGGITWRGTFYPLDILRLREIPAIPPTITGEIHEG
jgi:glycosyltransferase involved in cell wall biosynthesis